MHREIAVSKRYLTKTLSCLSVVAHSNRHSLVNRAEVAVVLIGGGVY